METDNEGNLTAYYVYGQGLISKGLTDGSTSYYHYDRRGSTVASTNSVGEVTDTYTYDIYGEQLFKEGTTENRFRYNGKYGVATDDNGLYYMRARYYNPKIKRFINRNVVQGSILEPQTFNRYAYVNGNPISYIDPFGLSREEDGSLIKNVYNFFIGDDINTLLNPNASSLERAMAGLSLASNFVPGGGVALKGLKVVGKLGKFKFINETISLLKSDTGSGPVDLFNIDDILILRHGKMKNMKLPVGQSNHLNQDAAYRSVIKREDGLAHKLKGSASGDIDSEHYLFHEVMEEFWDKYRDSSGKPIPDITPPTNGEYGAALEKALAATGMSQKNISKAVKMAKLQREEYELYDDKPVPQVPRKLWQKKRPN